jgi:hypothetical protein
MNQPPDSQARYAALISDPVLVRGGRAEPHWLNDGASFAFVDGSGAEPTIKRVDSATGDLLMAIDISAITGQSTPWQPAHVGLHVRDDTTLIVSAAGKHFALSVQNQTSTELGAGVADAFGRTLPHPLKPSYPAAIVPDLEVLCPDRSVFLTIMGYDLGVRPLAALENNTAPSFTTTTTAPGMSPRCRAVGRLRGSRRLHAECHTTHHDRRQSRSDFDQRRPQFTVVKPLRPSAR